VGHLPARPHHAHGLRAGDLGQGRDVTCSIVGEMPFPSLLAALLSLSPLGHASPSAEAWLNAFHDSSGHGDLIFLVTSPAVESSPLRPLHRISAVVGNVGEEKLASPRLVSLDLSPSRAPPTTQTISPA
jgi:hypothetical protein